jgi:hypothetical protein
VIWQYGGTIPTVHTAAEVNRQYGSTVLYWQL